ncbi:MAG: Holliday junction resolvase RuvX [Chloroflexi bacterium]|nr:Holliday junction resolvase RuvX [Chloroflexota bacterium]
MYRYSFTGYQRPPRSIGAAFLKRERCQATKILALDLGKRRIGVALSDALGIMATPLMVIASRGAEADVAGILKLVQDNAAERVVVGMPLSLDGSAGPEAQRVQEFIGLLSRSSPVPVESWDERLSTVAAEREMIAGGAGRSRRKQWRDAVAASLVLQSYLDRVRDVRP